MGFRRPSGTRHRKQASGQDEREPHPDDAMLLPGAIECYVDGFNAGEVAAGFLPSDTLGRFFAVLELRDVLRRNRRLRGEAPPVLARVATTAERPPVKKRRSVVQRLFRQGRLLRPHLSAADDIEDLFGAFSRGMFATARRLERVQESPAVRDLFDRLEPRHQRLMKDVYWPWLDWLGREPVTVYLSEGGTARYANPLPLVVDIVVDNSTIRQAEQHHGVRNGAGPAVLRAALHRYCLLAGYLHLPEAVEAQQPSERGRWRRRRGR